MKCNKHQKLTGFEIKQKVTNYYNEKSAGNSQDARISKSCPPVQNSNQNSAQNVGGQPSSAFKQFSAFQPFVRKQSFNQQSEDNSQKMNKNNFHNHPGGSSINLSNQGGPLNKSYPDSFNQN